jgi:multidrug efflux pump subunit AcrB
LNKIYVKSSTGQMVPLSAFAKVKTTTAPARHRPPGPVPGRDFVVQPAAWRVIRCAAVKAIQSAEQEIGLPDTVVATFSGQRC